MPQGEIIGLAIFAGFLFFITARGTLGTYLELLI